jgi:hypothetical protein
MIPSMKVSCNWRILGSMAREAGSSDFPAVLFLLVLQEIRKEEKISTKRILYTGFIFFISAF